ncbi:hypothetical protein B7463_g8376, partial [Scytalidium lignicola]
MVNYTGKHLQLYRYTLGQCSPGLRSPADTYGLAQTPASTVECSRRGPPQAPTLWAMRAAIAVALIVDLRWLPLAKVQSCSATVPCAIGCCDKYGVCGLGPDFCSTENCVNSCDAKAECNPDNWPSQYVSSTTCPLNVCCSQYGFCGTTEEFCGNSTVQRPSCDIGSQSITRVIGYYASGSASRSCDAMIPQSFPQGVYSHIYFAFGSINPDTFEVIPADAPTATTFSDLATAPITHQNVFFSSLTLFMTTWGFTGVDIDWEYPAADDRNSRPEDYENFPKFLSNLKTALDEYKFGLSIMLPTSYWYLQHFDLAAIEPSVDWFNYMSYDLHGTWDIGNEWTGAYLDAHTNLTEIIDTLDLLWRNNITPSKVNLGLAFYGCSFTIVSSSCSAPGCAYLSAGDAGDCSATAGILFNSEIEELINENNLSLILYSDAAVKVITWNEDQWASFDDQDTWKLKADFAKSQCLGSVFVWSVDYDDSNMTFSDGLAAAVGNELNVDSSTGLTISLHDTSAGNTQETQDQYCRFINCGEDMINILDTRVDEYIGDNGVNSNTIRNTLYESSWCGIPQFGPNTLISDYLCNIYTSANGIASLDGAALGLCEYVAPSSSLDKRVLADISAWKLSETTTNDHSGDGTQPSIMKALAGIVSGDLTLHYLRWISSGNRQVLLEVAFWIGPQVGVQPAPDLLVLYSDSDHTAYPDRWVIFHLHIPLDRFADGADIVFNSRNAGGMQNYNARSQPVACQRSGRQVNRWYIGTDRTASIDAVPRPPGFSHAMNQWGIWLYNQGVFDLENLRYLWPSLNSDMGSSTDFSNTNVYRPKAYAFDYNWLPDGMLPTNFQATSPVTPSQ